MATTAPGEAADAELIRRATAGDREAFAAIYQRYHRIVFRFARMMSGSPTVAEDVTQEVFMALLKDLGRYSPDRAVLSTYLYGIARNVTRSHLRQRGRFTELKDVSLDFSHDHPAGGADQTDALIAAQNLVRLRAVIAGLPSRYREALILCDLHGLSYAEAATAIETPVGTLRSRLHRARSLVQTRMQQHQGSSSGAMRRAPCIA